MTFASSPDDPPAEDCWNELADAWLVAAEKHGFATPIRPVQAPDVVQRRRRVRFQTNAAINLVMQVQQSLADEDPEVRQIARDSTRRVMHRCYTGDQSDRAWRASVKPWPADRLVTRILGSPDPDLPEPRWMDGGVQRTVRRLLIATALGLAIGAASLISVRQAGPALALVFFAGTFDVLEGAYARTVGMKDSGLRWLSCVASHIGDLLVFGAIAYAESSQSSKWAAFLLLSILLSLLGSFVRVSALQAGYQFWRSHSERFVRYLAIITYCVTAATGHQRVGVALVCPILITYGAAEITRVVQAVVRMPSIQGAGLVFVDTDDELRWWGLADEGGSNAWLSGVQDRMERLLSHN